MLSAVGMRVMLETIELIDRDFISSLHKSDVSSHMHLFAKRKIEVHAQQVEKSAPNVCASLDVLKAVFV